MSLDHNKTLAKLFFTEMYSNWRLEIIDDIIHPDYFISRHSVSLIQYNNSMPNQPGRKSLKKRVLYFRKAMPDLKYEIIKTAAEGDEVIVWWIWTGTQRDELFGFPSKGNSMRIFGTNLFTFKDGKILNTLVTFDSFSMLIQLGHVQIETGDPLFIDQYLKNIEKVTQDMS